MLPQFKKLNNDTYQNQDSQIRFRLSSLHQKQEQSDFKPRLYSLHTPENDISNEKLKNQIKMDQKHAYFNAFNLKKSFNTKSRFLNNNDKNLKFKKDIKKVIQKEHIQYSFGNNSVNQDSYNMQNSLIDVNKSLIENTVIMKQQEKILKDRMFKKFVLQSNNQLDSFQNINISKILDPQKPQQTIQRQNQSNFYKSKNISDHQDNKDQFYKPKLPKKMNVESLININQNDSIIIQKNYSLPKQNLSKIQKYVQIQSQDSIRSQFSYFSNKSQKIPQQEETTKELDQEQNQKFSKLINDSFLKLKKVNDNQIKQQFLVRNSYDAIKYFGVHGVNSEKQFFYLVHEFDLNKQFKPYDLKVIRIEERDKFDNIFLITNLGITWLKDQNSNPDKFENQLISFEDWLREAAIFNVMSQISVFKNYSIQKAFQYWKRSMKIFEYKQIRNQLANKCIWSSKHFKDSIKNIIEISYNFHTHRLIDQESISYRQDYSINNFLSKQYDQRKLSLQSQEQQVELIKDQINVILKNNNQKFFNEIDYFKQQNIENAGKNKSVPMYMITNQKIQKKKFKENLKRNQNLLNNCLRLIDYIIQWNLLLMVKESLNEFSNAIKRCEQESKGMLKCQANFKANVIAFNPTEETIIKQLEEILLNIFAGIITKNMAEIYDQQRISRIKFQELIKKSDAYTQGLDILYQQIRNDFQINNEYAKEFMRKFYRLYEDYGYLQQEQERQDFLNKDWDIGEVKQQFQEFQNYQFEVKSYMHDKTRGFVAVYYNHIKYLLLDHIKFKLDFFKENLQKQLREITDQSLCILEEHLEKLRKSPEQLTDFINYVQQRNTALNEFPNLQRKIKNIEYINYVIKKYELNITRNLDQQNYEQIINYAQDLEELFENSEQFIQNSFQNQVQIFYLKQEQLKDQMSITLNEQINCSFFDKHNSQQDLVQKLPEIKHKLKDIKKQIDKYKNEIKNFQMYQSVLNINYENKGISEELESAFAEKNQLWKIIEQFNQNQHDWLNNPLQDLNINDIEIQMKEYEKFITQYKIKQGKINYHSNLDQLQIDVKELSNYMPLIQAVCNQNLRPRHWQKILQQFPKNLMVQSKFSIKTLIKYDALEKKEVLEEISALATGEALIESQLENISKKWGELQFQLAPFQNSNDTFKLVGIEDLIPTIEEHQLSIQTMLDTKFVTQIKSTVDDWDKKLKLFRQNIQLLLIFQKKWGYLENIFNAQDIQRQLPKETNQFQTINRFWKAQMKKIQKNPTVSQICNNEGLLYQLTINNRILDDIQVCLDEYLDLKRSNFPRFYFLSNDELLQILSQTRNLQAVQPHLKKCFENINKVKFENQENNVLITKMISSEPESLPEKVKFINPIQIEDDDQVENWLVKIQNMMIQTLQIQTIQCLQENPDWIDQQKTKNAAQVIIILEQINWQQNCTQAIADQKLKDYFNEYQYTINKLIYKVRENLNILKRTLVCTILVIDVHLRDIIELLIQNNIDDLNNFFWQKQLRYYCVDNLINVKIMNFHFIYRYEYLGNGSRLVMTPLTDACYLTMTNAIKYYFGGASNGPAGTGKTETIKDLSKTLAIQCLVYNCSNSIDVKIMRRFFNGLAQNGAWACFDEFNRIDIEVLSVISQQLQTLQSGLKAQSKLIEFEGKKIPLEKDFSVFITMNPTYLGRSELPENLKSYFRPISMMTPDFAMISEIIFLSEGFQQAKYLGQKLIQIYKLSEQQLSKQKHYDFGMRGLKSVLNLSGNLRRQNKHQNEVQIAIRSIVESNIQKFVLMDLPIFNNILNDSFPNNQFVTTCYKDLENKICQKLTEYNMEKLPGQIEKIIQLYEIKQSRWGVMIIGETQCGKSTVQKILKESVDEQIIQYQINPKALSTNQIYGYVNSMTNEWNDGIIVKILRESQNDNIRNFWILFDGPVDPVWIEDFNAVLDENKTLCLSNGQRFKIQKNVIFMFEVENLKYATPATVSRCGILYMDYNQLTAKAIINCYFHKLINRLELHLLNQKSQKNLTQQIQNVQRNLEDFNIDFEIYAQTNYKQAIQVGYMNQLQTFLDLFDELVDYMILQSEGIEKFETKYYQIEQEQFFNMITCFAIIWSFGSNTFNQDHFLLIKKKILNIYMTFPVDGDLTDFYINFQVKQLRHWQEIIPKYDHDQNKQQFYQIYVPNVNTVRFEYLLNILIKKQHNCLILGSQGVGKSLLIQNYLSNQKFESIHQNFSPQTTAQLLSEIFYNKDYFIQKSQVVQNEFLIKKTQHYLNTLNDQKIVISIDDINLPSIETYGAQSSLEFLRKAIDNKTFYDDKLKDFIEIQNVVFLATCSETKSIGRQEMSARLTRHFKVLQIPDLSNKQIYDIYIEILKDHLQANQELDLEIIKLIMSNTISIHFKLVHILFPTPNKFYYFFNLNDISQVILGLFQIEQKNIINKDYLLQFWIHEIQRTYLDKLSHQDDRQQFLGLIVDVLQNENYQHYNIENIQEIQFSCYLNKNKLYQKIEPYEDKQKTLYDKLLMLNMGNSVKLDLYFFKEAIENINKICRILRLPRGNCVTIGMTGSGRNSLIKLSAFLMNIQLFQIQLNNNYKEQQWKDDIKKLLKLVGLKQQKIVFLFNENQIIKEVFIQDINNILYNGEIPGFFAQEDYEEILSEMRIQKQNGDKKIKKKDLMQFFYNNIQENLHIFLVFLSKGDNLRNICRKYQAILEKCKFLWFFDWPQSALYDLAIRKFQKNDNLQIGHIIEKLGQASKQIHYSVQEASVNYYIKFKTNIYVIQNQYLIMLNYFIYFLQAQWSQLPKQIHKFKVGLQCIKDTNMEVQKLKQTILEFQPILIKQKDTNLQILKELEAKKAINKEVEQKMILDEKDTQKQRDEVIQIRKQCQFKYDEALPQLKEAQKAVMQIEKGQLNIIKSFKNPPQLVVVVLNAIACLFDVPQTWEQTKRYLLADIKFQEKLVEFNVDSCPEIRFQKLRENFLTRSDFNHEQIFKQSQAAACLFSWIKAIDSYELVHKIVVPIQSNLQNQQVILQDLEEKIHEQQQNLLEIQTHIAGLNEKLAKSQFELNDLQTKISQATDQYERAESLLKRLSSESDRWQISFNQLNSNTTNIAGNMLISASYQSYLGPFNSIFRKQLNDQWVKSFIISGIQVNKDFQLEQVLSTFEQLIDWKLQQLPDDKQSIQNGIIIQNSFQYPLIIDPQGQAKNWLKNMHSNIKQSKLNDPQVFRSLENCIQFGQPFMIQHDSEFLDAILDPILNKNVIKKGGQQFIKFGEQNIPYHNDFKLFIITILANPHYLPDIISKINLVNFSINFDGLEEQLLGYILNIEKGELEKERIYLSQKIVQYQYKLEEMNNIILNQLQEQQQKLLEQDDLIQTLDTVYVITQDVNKNLQISKETQQKVQQAREQFRELAKRSTILYFSIQELSKIDQIYQWSLDYFKKQINQILESSPQFPNLVVKLQYLIKQSTKQIYQHIQESLFSKHKIFFGFIIAIKIQLKKEKIEEKQVKFLFQQRSQQFYEDINKPNFLQKNQWNDILSLESLDSGCNLVQSILNNNQFWISFLQSDDPYLLKLPNDIFANDFFKLILVKILKPEQFTKSLIKYIQNSTGIPEMLDIGPQDLNLIFEESNNKTPLFFLISKGLDPQQKILDFHDNYHNPNQKLLKVSMGQNQGERAKEALRLGKKYGHWVLLQNLHISQSWLSNLDEVYQNNQEIHKRFRLWLTSMPISTIPIQILQNSIKINNEPPNGVKEVLNEIYYNMKDNYDYLNKPMKQIVFNLAFFHAVILQRKKFNKFGWNQQYEWIKSDFDISYFQILEQKTQSLNFYEIMIAEINYGGRVTDFKDMIILKQLIQGFLNEQEDDNNQQKFLNYEYPESFEKNDILNILTNYPKQDNPKIFGLHYNASIIQEIENSQHFIELIQKIYESANSDNIFSIQAEQTFISINKKINNFLIDIKFKKSDDKSHVLYYYKQQETMKYNILIQVIRTTLANMVQAIRGEKYLDSELENCMNDLLNKKVPKQWLQYSYNFNDYLMSWIEDLQQKIQFMQKWNQSNQINSYLISAFFYPQSFFTYLKQHFSRQNQLQIDQVKIKSQIQTNDTNDSNFSLIIEGLSLQACQFNFQTLQIEDLQTESYFQNVPFIKIQAINHQQQLNGQYFNCPLYKSNLAQADLLGTNYVIDLQLLTNQPSEFWIKRGVSLLCQQQI